MSDQGTSVTLIFYRVGSQWWKEPALNLLAAGFQLSPYTHVELAIGEVSHAFLLKSTPTHLLTHLLYPQDAGAHGMMSNVARVFNGAQIFTHRPTTLF